MSADGHRPLPLHRLHPALSEPCTACTLHPRASVSPVSFLLTLSLLAIPAFHSGQKSVRSGVTWLTHPLICLSLSCLLHGDCSRPASAAKPLPSLSTHLSAFTRQNPQPPSTPLTRSQPHPPSLPHRPLLPGWRRSHRFAP